MKHLVFVRGPESSFKRQIVDALMHHFNPDINTVRAFRISLNERLRRDWSDKHKVKAADKDCKNLVKKVLGGNHQEEFILIDNESLLPVHWQSYNNLAEGVSVNAPMIGIDVYLENFSSSEEERKTNLQIDKSAVFIASCYKYDCIKNYDDLKRVIETFRKLTTEGA